MSTNANAELEEASNGQASEKTVNLTTGSTEEAEIECSIANEFRFYSEEIKPFVDMVETFYAAVPDGLFNEVRSCFGHLSDAKIRTTDSIDFRKKNVEDAHGHLRRLLLDCYKLIIIYFQDYIKKFQKKFKMYNLSDLDDGNFLVALKKKLDKAEQSFITAKSHERTGKNRRKGGDEGSVYKDYEVAFNDYYDAKKYIDDHYAGAIRLARKHFFWKVVGFLGWAIGVALAIVSMLLGFEII